MDPSQTKSIRLKAYAAIKKRLNAWKSEFLKEINNGYAYIRSMKVFMIESELLAIVQSAMTLGSEAIKVLGFETRQILLSGVDTARTGLVESLATGLTATLSRLVSSLTTTLINLTSGIVRIGQAKTSVSKAFKQAYVGAKQVLRTEIVKARNVAVILEAKGAAQLHGRVINVKWVHVLHGVSRPEHISWHGMVFTLADASSRLGKPNCRCSITPTFAALST